MAVGFFKGKFAERRLFGVAMGVIAIVYVLTEYPGVGGRINQGDSAKFQFLARELGLGHPPGNPLYLMLGALWVRLPWPFADWATVTLLSTICALLTLFITFRTLCNLDTDDRHHGAFVGLLLLAFGPLFWTLATEAEVYSLATIFVAGVLWGMSRYLIDQARSGLLAALAFWLVGFANHLSIVALAPAMVWVLYRARVELRRPSFWGTVVLSAAVGAGSYGYVAFRASAHARYSEFPMPLTAEHFWEYVTARQFQGEFGHLALGVALRERLPSLFAYLERQWLWPVLLLAPFGFIYLFRRRRPFAMFLALGLAGQLAFAFLYRIPDPEGFFLPVIVLLVLPLAFASSDFTPAARRWTLRGMLLASVLFGVAHLDQWRRYPWDEVYQETREGRVVVNFPEIASFVPPGAQIAVPCGHYGCIQITNYFRLVDPAFRAKNLEFVKLAWSDWDDGLGTLATVEPPFTGRTLCVLLNDDLKKLADKGVQFSRIDRGETRRLGRRIQNAPIHCTP